MKRIALLAAIPALALLAACGPTETKAADGAPADRKAAAGRVADGRDSGSAPGVTEQELAAVQQVAACLRGQGVKVDDPKVGVPFDTSGMDTAFSDNRDLFSKALVACPDYKSVVIGVK
jgi:hypothetical protein